jgi:flagellar assembly protein FliH
MAGIIKASGRQEPAQSGVARTFHFDDVGESYIGRIRAEAARIVAEARQEAAKIKLRATEEGRQAAIAAAQASLKQRLDSQLTNVMAALDQVTKTIEQSRHAWQQHWEQHAVGLATAIAARICRRELSKHPDITLQWVREALELVAGNAAIEVHLNAEDHAALAEHVEQIAQRLTGLGTIRIAADSTVSAGGVRVETQFGSLDEQLETQLARIAEELLS